MWDSSDYIVPPEVIFAFYSGAPVFVLYKLGTILMKLVNL